MKIEITAYVEKSFIPKKDQDCVIDFKLYLEVQFLLHE